MADNIAVGIATGACPFDKDASAPSLAEAVETRFLPKYADVREWINGLS